MPKQALFCQENLSNFSFFNGKFMCNIICNNTKNKNILILKINTKIPFNVQNRKKEREKRKTKQQLCIIHKFNESLYCRFSSSSAATERYKIKVIFKSHKNTRTHAHTHT